MVLFWIAAALLSAAAAAVVLWRASRVPETAEPGERAVYARHLAELDDLRARALLDDEGLRAARAEAGRRLLSASDREPNEPDAAPTRRERTLVLVGVAVAAILGVGLYLAVGSPDRPDEPFASRLQSWRAADPAGLEPAQMAAVLKELSKQRPDDPQVWSYLGRAYAASGDALGAAQAFQKAVALKPDRGRDWAALGESLVEFDDGRIGPDARRAFEQALKVDPTSPGARYYLGKAEILAGNRAGGLAHWRQLAASMPAGPARAELEGQIEAVASGKADAARAVAEAAPQDQAEMIRGMVAGLAARLEKTPNDPQGWATLVRAYGVLGETASQEKALTRARSLFANRPADLAKIEAEARK